MFSKDVPKGSLCPMLNKQCVEHQCAWYTQVRGTNPNTGQEVDNYGCAVAWMPILLIDNTQKQRETGAAVESFRNEVVEANTQERALRLVEQGLPPALRLTGQA